MANYHSYYSDKTSLKFGEIPKSEDIVARHANLKANKIIPCGEKWIPGQGYTLIFQGPEISEEIQDELCIKMY